MRHTKSHTGNRRSHHALRAVKLVACANCQVLIQSHRVCLACGYYRGIKVLDLVKKAEKKSRRLKKSGNNKEEAKETVK
jgi:large subunit ribosomal protein L32